MGEEIFHIGRQIERVINQRGMMKCVLANKLGLSESAVIRLRNRESVDVGLLQKIGNVLGYDFFQHYPIMTGEVGGEAVDKDGVIAEQAARIAELEGMVSELKGMELHYLRMCNEQLRESQRLLGASLRIGAAQKGKEKKKDTLFG